MNQILQRIKKAYHLETDAEVAKFLGIKPSTLSMQKNRERLNLNLILEKCSDLNKNWLLDGVGQIWEPEQSGRQKISIYSSLSITDSNELDCQKSVKNGDIFTDLGQNGLDLPITDQIIGYIISEGPALQMLEKDDIVFIDLGKTAPQDTVSYLLSTDHQLFCGRIKKRSDEYILQGNDLSSAVSNGDFSIIGEIVYVMRKYNS